MLYWCIVVQEACCVYAIVCEKYGLRCIKFEVSYIFGSVVIKHLLVYFGIMLNVNYMLMNELVMFSMFMNCF